MGLMIFGTRKQANIRRSSEQGVGAVKLKARGSAAGEPKTADDLAIDAREDPGKVRRVRFFGAAVVGAFKTSLGGKTDTDQALRRAILAPPEATIATVERVVIFTGIGSPGARPPFGSAKFQSVGHHRRGGDTPIEPITAEICEPATRGQPIAQGIQSGGALIFGMRPCQNTTIPR